MPFPHLTFLIITQHPLSVKALAEFTEKFYIFESFFVIIYDGDTVKLTFSKGLLTPLLDSITY